MARCGPWSSFDETLAELAQQHEMLRAENAKLKHEAYCLQGKYSTVQSAGPATDSLTPSDPWVDVWKSQAGQAGPRMQTLVPPRVLPTHERSRLDPTPRLEKETPRPNSSRKAPRENSSREDLPLPNGQPVSLADASDNLRANATAAAQISSIMQRDERDGALDIQLAPVVESAMETTKAALTSVVGTTQALQARLEGKLSSSTSKFVMNERISGSFRFVHSEAFNLFSACLILANTVYMGVESDFKLRHELDRVTGIVGEEEFDWRVGDLIFCFCFVCELLLRVVAFRSAFFFGSERSWNLFDATVVGVSVIEILFAYAGESLSMGISVLRTLRVIRIIRLMRSLNYFEVMRTLKIMLYSLTGSASSFASALILLGSVMYIFALLFMQGIKGHLQGSPNPASIPLYVKHWGSLHKSLWTLVGAVTGGHDWIVVAEPIVEIGWIYVVFFLSYIFFVLIGLLNVLNGVFVNAALQASAANRELAVSDILAHQRRMMEDMVNLFVEADKDKSGTVSLEEMEAYLEDESIRAYFTALELDMTHVSRIFKMLDEHRNGNIDICEFVQGCIRLRGTAKIIDVQVMQEDFEDIRARFVSFDLQLAGLHDMLRGLVETSYV